MSPPWPLATPKAVPVLASRRSTERTPSSGKLASLGRRTAPALRALLLTAGLLSLSETAAAQDFGGMDSQALPRPMAPGEFPTLASSSPAEEGHVSAGVRTSYLAAPISGSLPSASPSPTPTSIVEGQVLLELTGSAALPAGFDVGLALPFHLGSWGSGLGAAGGREGLSQPNFADPRVGLGWGRSFSKVSLRGYGWLYLPLGSPEDFAGEDTARSELGIASGLETGAFSFQLNAAAILRRRSTLGLTTWGPQLHLGLGGKAALGRGWSSGVAMHLMPTLYSQPEPLLGGAGYLFPAEAVAHVTLDLERWGLTLLGGSGLPFSRPSGQVPSAGLTRGPTSPTLRLALDLALKF